MVAHFLRMQEDDLHLWHADPEGFVSEQELDSAGHDIRVSCFMFLLFVFVGSLLES